jgi:hypothetical protein
MSRIDELERRLAEVERQLGINPGVATPGIALPMVPQWPVYSQPDCKCGPTTVCGNTACPRLWRHIANTTAARAQ